MVNINKLNAAIVVATSLFGAATAHPGEHHDVEHIKRELQTREVLATRASSSLSKCANSPKFRDLKKRAVSRRSATAERLRKERGLATEDAYLHRRDLATLQKYEKVNHNMTGSINAADPSVLFSSNTSCILTPENTIGPYYVSGELLRQDVTEGQQGVPLHLEMQFVDVNTCEPVPDLLIDIWACNATGVYSGVDSTGEGGLNTTFLRGLQKSDRDGVAQFDTIFPGHYSGRATHEHTVVHTNASLLPNGSYTGGTVSHIGQIFFDESLRSAVESTYPYNTNTIEVLSNDDDMWAPSQADNNYDPFPDYVYLGNDITDGLLAWISIGIDPSADRDSNATAAAYWAADGGHSTGNNVGGGGSAPSGSFPSSSSLPSSSSVLSAREYNLKKLFGGSAHRAY
ncbi:hypothetical protein Plec18167_008290 [Paecilomyces lecythidis]|uniref:Intradiol ring-cleavage dioxygenases domain-containing protein n=1 Tax=Paecilomyces lecythidis TaxID=3004212 RepID=A0ABR3WY96_9EURO